LIARLLADAGYDERAHAPLAAVALGSLVHYRLEETMFGSPPAGVGEEEFIETWVDVWMRVAQTGAVEAPEHAATK
jgi:hypothetical protein